MVTNSFYHSLHLLPDNASQLYAFREVLSLNYLVQTSLPETVGIRKIDRSLQFCCDTLMSRKLFTVIEWYDIYS